MSFRNVFYTKGHFGFLSFIKMSFSAPEKCSLTTFGE